MENPETHFPERIFITGTDTDIGKTVVSAILMAGLKGTYWKPVQSGLDGVTDTQWVKEKTGLPGFHFREEIYRLTKPLSPHASAAIDGIRIDLNAFDMPEMVENGHLIIEGAGGIMVPLNEKHFILDLIEKTGAEILLVTRSTLGTINHTLLTLRQLRERGLKIMGVVMNGPGNMGNREAIEHYGDIKVLAEIKHLENINPQSLEQCFREHF